ncbi:hypothetical protein [Pseudomonas helleri]|uniref:hypothetical protein n=1 Tax=Pseudomonas helleri TaxID=1608996 RepID=UPI003FD2E20A
MTVSTIGSVAEFDTNGVTTNYPFYFKFLDSRDLVVTYIDPEDVSTVLVMGAHYTVSGAGNDKGGSVTTTAVLRGPGKLIVSRDMEAYQKTSLRNQGKFLAETHEDVFDRLAMLSQQGLEGLKRALSKPFGREYFHAENQRIKGLADPESPNDAATKDYTDDSTAGAISYTDDRLLRTVRSVDGETLTQLPAVASRANKVMGFDANGQPIGVLPASGSGTELAIDLANPVDPKKGAGMQAFRRDTEYGPGSAGVALKGADVTPWEFADKLIYKPGANPAGWDWAPAINAALEKYGEISLGFGGYGVRSSVVIKPGYRVKGKGPGHAGGTAYSDIFAARIIALPGFIGDAVFVSKLNSSENVLTAPQLEQFRLDLSQCEAHGIHFLDVYDGVKFDNLHVVGTAEDKYACWIQDGGYGLGQTLLGTNCQFLRRPNSTSTLPVALFEALNESNLIGCKFFGSSGGVLASAGPAVEFKGCSGMTLVGCSAAFAADGIAVTDHPTRKTIGFTLISPTFEALTRTALTVRGSPARLASQVYLIAPRYYDSVFAMHNAIDIDYIERSDFDCQFKRAIVGRGADQNIVKAQRQSYLTDNGTNTLIISSPNASDPNYGINKRIRAIGGITSDGGIAQRVAIFTAETGVISVNFKAVIVNRSTIGRYSLPAASAMGDGFSPEIVIRSVGAGSVSIIANGSDLIEGKSELAVTSGGKARLVSDGVSNWYIV